MTLEEFTSLKPGIFEVGLISNTSEGVYLTDNREGDLLKWVAVKGYNDDWCIYADWVEKDIDLIRKSGQKIFGEENILKLISNKELLTKYRK